MHATSKSGHLTDVAVELVNARTGDIVETATTNDRGVAVLTAPDVSSVTRYDVISKKPGFANYIPAEDPRAWDYFQGFYPGPGCTVFPNQTVVPPVPLSPKLQIDEGFGIFGPGTIHLGDEVEAKAEKAGWEFGWDWWVGDETICDHVGSLGPKDAWVFSGHGIKDSSKPGNPAVAIAGWRPYCWIPAVGYTKVTMEDICKCFNENGAPGIVFLDCCDGADLLDDLVECCVKLAVGWRGSAAGRQSFGAMTEFFCALFEGKTVETARDIAERHARRTFNPNSVELKVKAKPWMSGGNVGNWRLEQIQNATKPESDEEE